VAGRRGGREWHGSSTQPQPAGLWWWGGGQHFSARSRSHLPDGQPVGRWGGWSAQHAAHVLVRLGRRWQWGICGCGVRHRCSSAGIQVLGLWRRCRRSTGHVARRRRRHAVRGLRVAAIPSDPQLRGPLSSYHDHLATAAGAGGRICDHHILSHHAGAWTWCGRAGRPESCRWRRLGCPERDFGRDACGERDVNASDAGCAVHLVVAVAGADFTHPCNVHPLHRRCHRRVEWHQCHHRSGRPPGATRRCLGLWWERDGTARRCHRGGPPQRVVLSCTAANAAASAGQSSVGWLHQSKRHQLPPARDSAGHVHLCCKLVPRMHLPCSRQLPAIRCC